MKKTALLMAVIAMALSLTSCGKKCVGCGESNMFGNTNINDSIICKYCIEDLRSLGAIK